MLTLLVRVASCDGSWVWQDDFEMPTASSEQLGDEIPLTIRLLGYKNGLLGNLKGTLVFLIFA